MIISDKEAIQQSYMSIDYTADTSMEFLTGKINVKFRRTRLKKEISLRQVCLIIKY